MLPTVLLVDDHQPWRRQIRSLLESAGAAQIAGEAGDGADAVALARDLRPDVILLDIELPVLNGVEIATRILAENPAARILFLSGHRSWDVIEAALATGARGFVVKVYAATEVLPALRAVAAGRRFLSPVLGGRQVIATAPPSHFHEAGFYASDAELTAEYERFAAAALGAGKAVIALLETARRHELDRRLRARGIDLDRAIADDRYLVLDVAEVVPPMLVNGMPDATLFWQGAIALAMRVARASAQTPPAIAGFGDCSQSLWKAGRGEAAVRLEQLWDEFVRTFNVEVLCGYSVPTAGLTEDESYRGICAAHSAAYIG